ncbi:MAG: hypothetical protein PWR01_3988 [Clostridiales bacterium]|nr:hypothetical protein [Clostridiales bacterium]MDN5282915.1 hypothetical protein [Candidatus Ozemobacter sp.]
MEDQNKTKMPTTSAKTKIAIAAIKLMDFEIEHNLLQFHEAMHMAKRSQCDFLMLGEAALNGFSGLTWNYQIDAGKHAISLDSHIIERIKKFCKEIEIGLGFGFYEKAHPFIYSSYLILDKSAKILENYRRISTGWKESVASDEFYKEGDKLSSIKLGSSKCTIALCGDLWTEDFVKNVAIHESDTILWPLYIDYTKNEWENFAKDEYLNQVKSIGKRTILINSRGSSENSAKGGLIDISASGEVIDEVEMDSSSLLVLEL